MSIFGGNYNGSTLTPPVFEGYSCERNGDLIAIQEGYEDQLAIIEAIHTLDMAELNLRSEVKQLTESADIAEKEAEFAAVYESALGDVVGKIKAFFMKMWGKLKAFFNSVIRFFDGIFKSGKDFVTKYEKDLRKLDLNGYEYKMYNYDDKALDEGGKASDFLSTAQNQANQAFWTIGDKEASIKKLEDGKEEFLDKLRGSYVGKGSLDNEEYHEQLFAHFRNGATSDSDKEEVKINIGTIIQTLKEGKALKTAEDALKDVDTVFEKEIKAIEKDAGAREKDSVSKAEGVTEKDRKESGLMAGYLHKKASLFSEVKNVALDFFRAWKDAVVERNNVYKSVCTSAFRYKKEK